jgi:hypothetical protein
MKALRLAVPLAALLLALFAMRDRLEPRAEVVCRGSRLGLECTVANREGRTPLKVTWDIRLTCRNGTVIRASASERVPRNDQFVHLIPLADLKGLERCDAGESLVVENVASRASP